MTTYLKTKHFIKFVNPLIIKPYYQTIFTSLAAMLLCTFTLPRLSPLHLHLHHHLP